MNSEVEAKWRGGFQVLVGSFYDSHFKTLLRSSVWTLASQGSVVLGSFVKTVLLARALGPANFGILAGVQAIVINVQQVFDLNLPQTIIRYGHILSQDESTVRWFAFLRGVFNASSVITVLFGLAIGSLFAFGSTLSVWVVSPKYAALGLAFLCVGAAIDLFVSQWAGLLKLKFHFKELAAVEFVTVVLELGLLFWLILGLGGGLGGVLVVSGVTLVLKSSAIVCVLLKKFPEIRGAFFIQSVANLGSIRKDIYSFTIENSISRTLKSFFSSGDVLLLGIIALPAQVGFYSAAKKLGLSIVLLTQPLLSSIYTQLAQLVAGKKAHEAWRLSLKVTMVGSLAAMPIFLLMHRFSDELIHLVLGSDFLPAKNLFLALTFLGLVRAIFFWTNGLILSLGLSRFRLVWDLLTILIWLTLSALFLSFTEPAMAVALAAVSAQLIRELSTMARSKSEVAKVGNFST